MVASRSGRLDSLSGMNMILVAGKGVREAQPHVAGKLARLVIHCKGMGKKVET